MKPGSVGRQREERFKRVMERRGIALVRPQASFRFQRSSYLPDFFSPAEGVHYEVLGSPGPTNRMALVLDLMAVFYPLAKIICVKPSGESFDPCTLLVSRRYAGISKLPFGDALLRRMTSERMRYQEIAKVAGLSHSHFSHFVHGRRRLPARAYQRLEQFARGSV